MTASDPSQPLRVALRLLASQAAMEVSVLAMTDPFKVLRNTRTLGAYRTRSMAAQRVAMPFIMLPALLSGVPVLAVRWLPELHRGPIELIVCLAIAWLSLMVASLVYGDYRRQHYLNQHPWTDADESPQGAISELL